MFDIKINGHVHKITAEEIESNLSKETKEIIMNYNEEAKKRRTCPVYSSTYDNGGWSERDGLPEGDPIGDVDEPKTIKETTKSIKKDEKTYFEMMRGRLLNPEGKNFDYGFTIEEIKEQFYASINKKTDCCSSPDRYINGIGGLRFYSCRNCGADLGDC